MLALWRFAAWSRRRRGCRGCSRRMRSRSMRSGCVGARNAGRLRARCTASERQQRDVARALDRFAEPALVTRADAGHAARQNLPTLLDKLRQDVRALVVDEVHLLDAELADFLLAKIL